MGKMIEEVNGEWAEDLILIYIVFDKINKDSDSETVRLLRNKISKLDSKIGEYRISRYNKKKKS